MQLIYSRNIKGPNNFAPEEYQFSSAKFTTNPPPNLAQSIMIKRDGKSPYVHADLEELKQYVSQPKKTGGKTHKRSKSQTLKSNNKTRKAVRSALRAEHLRTEETEADSTSKLKNYSSHQSSFLFRGSKKNVMLNKGGKVKQLFKKNKR